MRSGAACMRESADRSTSSPPTSSGWQLPRSPSLVPHLQGFVLQGTFGAELETRIDYANLEALELHGKVGIDGCKVVKPPPGVKAILSGESIVQQVEVPKAPAKK